MNAPTSAAAPAYEPAKVAKAFVEARLSRRALAAFPGPLPADMAEGYRTQEAAIDLWPDAVAGWKVGRVPEDLQAELGARSVMGPIFAANVWQADASAPQSIAVIAGGFAAVEAEYVYRIGRDADPSRVDWTPQAALEIVETMLAGVEFAGSPLASINRLGPRVVAADFGNNAGLLLGDEISGWRDLDQAGPACATEVAGQLAGRGSPQSIPGGPATSLAFLLNACAARGRPLRAGQLVTTGAATGIHDIRAGETACISFDGLADLRLVAVAAEPIEAGGIADDRHNE